MTQKKSSDSKGKQTKPRVEKERLKDLDAEKSGDKVKGGQFSGRCLSMKACVKTP